MAAREYVKTKVKRIPRFIIQCFFVMMIVYVTLLCREVSRHPQLVSAQNAPGFIAGESKHTLIFWDMLLGLCLSGAVLEAGKKQPERHVSVLQRPPIRALAFLLYAVSLWVLGYGILNPTSAISTGAIAVGLVMSSSAQVLLILMFLPSFAAIPRSLAAATPKP